MRVLYISKALVVAAYRDKLRALSNHADVTGVIPERWGREGYEPIAPGPAPVRPWPVLFHGRNHLHLYRRPRRMVAESRADLVHVDEEPYSAVTWQMARVCERCDLPWVFFAWQNLRKRLPPPFAAVRAHNFRHAAGAIAGTQPAADVLREAGFAGPVAVIPQLGVDVVRFRTDAAARIALRRRIGAVDGDVIVGYGGRIVPEKGVGLLLAVLPQLPQLRLVIIGEGPDRGRLEDEAERAGVGTRVTFTGQLPSLEMPRWLAGLDVLALPTVGRPGWTEQFGRILVEAMACGAAVVGSSAGEIPRVVGDAGVIVPPGDERALADALRTLVEQPELRALLAERGRARVVERFTNDRIAADTVAFYRSILQRSA